MSVAFGHLGLKEQPFGLSEGAGGVPDIDINFSDESILGRHEINIFVYGCNGFVSTSSQSPDSCIEPLYITATDEHVFFTSERL